MYLPRVGGVGVGVSRNLHLMIEWFSIEFIVFWLGCYGIFYAFCN